MTHQVKPFNWNVAKYLHDHIHAPSTLLYLHQHGRSSTTHFPSAGCNITTTQHLSVFNYLLDSTFFDINLIGALPMTQCFHSFHNQRHIPFQEPLTFDRSLKKCTLFTCYVFYRFSLLFVYRTGMWHASCMLLSISLSWHASYITPGNTFNTQSTNPEHSER